MTNTNYRIALIPGDGVGHEMADRLIAVTVARGTARGPDDTQKQQAVQADGKSEQTYAD